MRNAEEESLNEGLEVDDPIFAMTATSNSCQTTTMDIISPTINLTTIEERAEATTK